MRALIVAFLGLLVLSACGSTDEPTGPGGQSSAAPGPTVADARFDGRFTVIGLDFADGPVEPALAPVITIETEFGALTVEPGCNTYYGSFSLLDDGSASFTVTGGSNRDCPDLADQEQAVLAVLDAVDGWAESGETLVLAGPDGRLELTRSG